MNVREARGRRPRIVGIGAALALVIGSVLGGLALQAPADAYPGTVCTVQITPADGHVQAGQSLTLIGKASTSTHWTVTINGIVHYYTGTTFTETYQVPASSQGSIGVTVACSNASGVLTLRYRIVVDPFSVPSRGSGHLPNTGGPSLWWLIAGIASAVSGGFLAWRRRPVPKPVGRHVRGG